MRQILIFILVAVVLSMLNRRRSRGAGPPVARGPVRFPGPARTTPPATPRATEPRKSGAADVQARRLRERMEQRRTDMRRRAEAEEAATAAEEAYGPRTEIPGGIDPRLLDKDRTPQPTPDPIDPR